MGALIARRLLALIPILLVVSFGVFMLISLVPGDAATTLAGGINATPERIEQVREQLHLDEHVLQQYGRWLGQALQGDFGTSLFSDVPVTEEITRRLPVTASLVFVASAIAVLIAVPLGLLSGIRPGSFRDHTVRLLASILIAIPSFWLAAVLVAYVAVRWGWLPASGFIRLTESPGEWLRHTLLPGIALGAAMAAVLALQLRASLIETMKSGYARTAWAKGARARQVVANHALKNASLAPLTVLGVQIGNLLGAAVIAEEIFGIQGLGTYFIRAIFAFDLPVIQAVTMVFVLWQVVASLVVDVAYGYVNPRVRVTE